VNILTEVEMAECDVFHIPGGFQYWPVSSTARAKAPLANTSTTLLRQIATHTMANAQASLFSFVCAVALRLTVSVKMDMVFSPISCLHCLEAKME
jgi:hypothetical protein